MREGRCATPPGARACLGSRPPPGAHEGRSGAAAISRRSTQQPGRLRPRPGPAQPAARLKTLKIKLVSGREEERARPGAQAAPGCGRERCCVMVPTWTPAFCPFSLRKSRRAPEPRKAAFGAQKHHSQMGSEALGWVGRSPRLFGPSISKTLQFLLCHQGSDLGRARGTGKGNSMDASGSWGMFSSRLGQKRHRGLESPCPLARPTAIGCQTQAPETSAPNAYSPWPAQSRVLEGGKRHLRIFYFRFLLTPSARLPWSLEEKAGRCFWRCYCKNNRVLFVVVLV